MQIQPMSYQELQEILNASEGVPATGVSPTPQTISLTPAEIDISSVLTPIGDEAGSVITYIDRPEEVSYSVENLPDWMKDFELVTPTALAPTQGVFDVAPVLDAVDREAARDYARDYAGLEKEFQESIAIDPSMFGGAYRSGIYMPTRDMDDVAPLEDMIDYSSILSAYELLRDKAPEMEMVQVDTAQPALPEAPQAPVVDLGDPTIDIPSIDLPSADIPIVDIDAQFPDIGIEAPAIPEIPDFSGIVPQVGDISELIPDFTLPEFDFDINIPEQSGGISSLIPEFEIPESVKAAARAAEDLAGAADEIIGLVDDPTVRAAREAIGEINKIAREKIGTEGDVIGETTTKFVSGAAAGAAISEAIDNPTASNLASAYEAVDYLTNQVGIDVLKGGDVAGQFGALLSGIEVLENGVKTPADAVAVSEAAQAIGSLTGSQATFDIAGSVASFLKPISAVHIGAQAINLIDRLFQGGAYGDVPNSSGTISWDGNNFVAGRASGGDGAASAWGSIAQDSALYGLKKLQSAGFEVDGAKASEILNSGVGNMASNSYYNTKNNRSNSPQKLIYELVKGGAIKPTANTPSKYLKSTDSFNKYLTNLFKSVQNRHARKLYDSYENLGGRARKTQPFVPFATRSAAENYVEDYGMKQIELSDPFGGNAYFSSYEVVERDGGYFLNQSTTEFKGNSTKGTKRTYNSFSSSFKPSKTETIDGKYIFRGYGAPTTPVGDSLYAGGVGSGFGSGVPKADEIFAYDPRIDGTGPQNEQKYRLYASYMSGTFGGWPIIQMPPKKSSVLGKDAKLYMDEDDYNRYFV